MEPEEVRQVQDAINISHPFGLKIWKPALYHKNRSIDQRTFQAVHSVPGSVHSLSFGIVVCNVFWTLLCGWWLSLLYLFVALLLCPFWLIGLLGRSDNQPNFFNDLEHSQNYIAVMLNLSWYIFHPFGKFVAKKKAYHLLFHQDIQEDEPLMEHTVDMDLSREQSQIEDDLWSEYSHPEPTNVWLPKFIRRLMDAGFSGAVFYLLTLIVLGPIHLLISGICFFLVFPVPMGKLNYYLLLHLLRHPLQLSAHPAVYYELSPGTPTGTGTPSTPKQRPKSIFTWADGGHIFSDPANSPALGPSVAVPSRDNREQISRDYQVVLCTYRAAGIEFYKFTVGGVNVYFINFLAFVGFTIIDFYILGPRNGFTGIADKSLIFFSSVLSTIPLSYFIGMAVSSITAQTGSVAIGSVINATFGSIVEIILYAIALLEGKDKLVEGAIIGSFLLGLLALPGSSMFFGGVKRKEQRFNAKSAGVTSTMLLLATIGVFTPTIFQHLYGTVEFHCEVCPTVDAADLDCKRCRFVSPHPTKDPIYAIATKPLMYFCAAVLVLAYSIGLWFTLRTHTSKIYPKKKKRTQTMRRNETGRPFSDSQLLEPPAIPFDNGESSAHRDDASSVESDEGSESGHANPGWGVFLSAFILLACTVLYALIAEILIDTLDPVLVYFPLSEKMLGLTLFAIVPTVTEFYNAIAFAVQGNIVLALEIGSAYVIQVALLQIPALVMFSALWSWFLETHPEMHRGKHTHFEAFSLVFPQWDFYSVLFGVFLLTYVYHEGKSNYFKGSILLLCYFIVFAGFLFEPTL
ncbi:Sodium/calcium exchanger protein-domain-containing protein [Gorgonomyces haynaldii]|nr:Sodium/calcium exchanger protein-domain-containing protein [Gorgonomyces haynaldii]